MTSVGNKLTWKETGGVQTLSHILLGKGIASQKEFGKSKM